MQISPPQFARLHLSGLPRLWRGAIAGLAPVRVSVLVSMLLAALLVGCSRPTPVEPPVRAVRTLTVQAGSAVQSHDYPAEIRARVESRLGFRVGGKLVSRSVGVGDAVRPGQALAQLDGRDLALGQEAARAALQSATAALEQNEAEFKRFQALREQGFIGAAELDRREAALKAARAQAEQARAQAAVQTNQAGYARLVADVAGVVTAVDAEPGAVLGAGTPVLRLAHDGPRDAVFAVPEDRVDEVRRRLNRPGAVRLQLRSDGAAPSVQATIREVAAAADPATRTFLVKADVGSSGLRLGQTATVRIEQVAAPAAIKLPVQAVFQYQGQASVWLLDTATMTVKHQPVQVAGADGNQVVLAQGLVPGQVVVSAGVHVLSPGQKVRQYAEPVSAPADRLQPVAQASAR